MASAIPSSATSSASSPDHGGPVVIDRMTRGGRRLHYELTVLQQPERARACGSGQKSASDRRPVDPPPVVQLRVLEGSNYNEAKDITFHYNANFFLYAGLELARPIAHGRVQTPAATSPPVLTGMPVSGMAYLDRPTEAGYFLFPDLSVRHEGRYRLQFHLYEEIKEDKDRDANSAPAPEPPADGAIDPSFDWRMEIKSVAFNVFSAKKFPGLSESTALSRTVAEQGCRVRIRRDVRMRRREGKGGAGGPTGDYDNAEEDYSRSRRTQTPEVPQHDQYRARSSSNASDHRAPYGPEPQRRSSGVEAYPPPPPPAYGPSQASSNVHLRFGQEAPPAPYPPPQYSQPSAQPPPISPTAPYHSNQPSPYQSAPPPPPPYGHPQSRPSSQHYTPTNPHAPQDPYDRRTSGVPPPPSPSRYAPQEPEYKRDHDLKRDAEQRRDSDYPTIPPLHSAPPADLGRVTLPPLGIMAAGPKPSTMLPSLSSYVHNRSRGEIIEPAPPMAHPPTDHVRIGGKRNFVETFVENSRPQKDGQRQQDSHHAPPPTHRPSQVIYNNDAYSTGQLIYQRASGNYAARPENRFTS